MDMLETQDYESLFSFASLSCQLDIDGKMPNVTVDIDGSYTDYVLDRRSFKGMESMVTRTNERKRLYDFNLNLIRVV